MAQTTQRPRGTPATRRAQERIDAVRRATAGSASTNAIVETVEVDEPMQKVTGFDPVAAGIRERAQAAVQADIEDDESDRDVTTTLEYQNFKRLAEQTRVPTVIRALDTLALLSDRSRYPARDKDIDAIEDILMSKLTEVISMFRSGRGRITTFHLPNGNEEDDDLPTEEELGESG